MRINSKIALTIFPLSLIFILLLSWYNYSAVRELILRQEDQILTFALDSVMAQIDEKNRSLQQVNEVDDQVKLTYAQEDLTGNLRRFSLTQNYHYIIVDDQGGVILSKNDAVGFDDNELLIRELAEILPAGNRPSPIEFNWADSSYIGAHQYFEPWGWHVIVARPTDVVTGQVVRQLWLSILIGLSVTLFLSGLGMIIVHGIMQPINELTAGARQIHAGNLDARIDVDMQQNEFTELAEAFNAMATGLQDTLVGLRYEMQEHVVTSEILKQSDERFQQLANNIHEAFWIADADGKPPYYVSPAYEKIWGISAEKVYDGRWKWAEHIHPEDAIMAYDAIREVPFDHEYRLVRPDGTVRWVRDRAFPVLDGDGNVYRVAGLAEDITDRKESEEILKSAQRLESIGLLAGGIAHDFNNLLTGILAQSTLAIRRLPNDAPAVNHMRKVTKSAERAADLTSQLLAYAGKGQFSIEAVEINQLIRDNIELLYVALPKHVSLCLEQQEDELYVWADRGQMQQIVMNLVINGAESINDEGGRITIRTYTEYVSDAHNEKFITNNRLEAGPYVFLEVEDDGNGMSADTIRRIFDPFFTTKEQGHGLGLSATLGIVKSHKGALAVSSRVGDGSLFSIMLPKHLPAEPIERKSIRGFDQIKSLPLNVLVIDDEAAVREAVSDILHGVGARVLVASNGRTGLTVYEQFKHEIDVVLLDMEMPILGGHQTFKLLREISPNVPIVVSSGYSRQAAVSKFEHERSLPFLQKPYDAQHLVQMLEQLSVRNVV